MKIQKPKGKKTVFFGVIALILTSQNCYAEEEKRGVVLYDQKGVLLTSPSWVHIDKWCIKEGISEQSVTVTYNVSHRERERLIGENYEDFVRTIVYPSIIKQCGDIELPEVSLRFRMRGDEIFWDAMSFSISNNGKSVVKNYYTPGNEAEISMSMEKLASLIPDDENNKWRDAGRTKEAQLNKIRNRKKSISAWGSSCRGAFCNLRGGTYLNAIYNNDVVAIKRMDALANQALHRSANKALGNSEMAKLMEKFRTREAPSVTFSLLPILADNYFYSYKHDFGFKCSEDLVSRRYRWSNDSYETYIGHIYTGQAGGEQLTASYIIKPAFVSLCDKVCNHLGGEAGRKALQRINHQPSLMTLFGLDDVPDNYSCSSSEVLQFEKHLMSLTKNYLVNKEIWN
ncbi:MAG: hypothetical protein ACPG52_10580 [Cognaticolwellia sp.]